MKVLLLSLVLVTGVCAQTSEELRKAFGPPTSEKYVEVYTVRPSNASTKLSAGATVTYSRDKSQIDIIRVDIYPQWVGFEIPTTKDEEVAKTKLLNEALAEIVPSDQRGRLITSGVYSGASIFGSFERYEKVRIFYSSGEQRYASVVFKEATRECRENPVHCYED